MLTIEGGKKMFKVKENVINNIIESKIKDKENIIKASHKIDEIREKFGNVKNGIDSTTILRKIRDSRLK